ncbi:MAG: type II toxin-antitoxin system VapB family antitoxin [Methylacidiphilales bacterium]|nr:type II toxin-antitoxin system VapB family antitoxin [Candidatus Methylacidiphilales bacterium]
MHAILSAMKMTMHIDEALLERVMEWTGAGSKTEAVALALKEFDRKARLKDFSRKGMGFTTAELKAAVDPSYDLMALRLAESPTTYKVRRKKK